MKCWSVFVLWLFTGFISAQNNDPDFQILYNSPSFLISSEKVLYETDQSDHFFIRYQIKNTGKNDVEFYLKEYQDLFYPNQWGITDTTERMIIDERRIIPGLKDTITGRMVRAHHQGQLVVIKPGETIDYYRDFNNGSKKTIQLKKNQYMYISMDGQLFYLFWKDAGEVGNADFEDEKFALSSTIYIPFPVTFKKIPAKAIIFYEN